jgi:predicted membrane channel-forming protein YqfA (hemolysin III family)
MVNGQTGQISGQRPADWVKIWLIIVAAMAPAMLLALAGGLLLLVGGLGFPLLLLAFVLATIGIVISLKLIQKAQELDDA